MGDMRFQTMIITALLTLLSLLADPVRADIPGPAEVKKAYSWTRRNPAYEALEQRFAPPKGFKRVAASDGSYAAWLRSLPLLPAGTPVRSYKGELIVSAGDPRLAAVVDLDLSRRDRQQCADTIMRLRGEHLLAAGKADKARYRWTGGKRFGYARWRAGIRPVKDGDRWRGFKKTAPRCAGRRCMRRYLEFLFAWTGTMHLQQEPRVKDPRKVQAGDFFIQGGSPGHTVVILDIARGPGGQLRALIGQGFMPAQDLHVMRGPDGPWFKLDPAAPGVQTPFWRAFTWKDLRRFAF